jgi:hypothetical protein
MAYAAIAAVVIWITTVGAAYYTAYVRGFRAGYHCHCDWFNRGLERLRDARNWTALAALADAMVGADAEEHAAQRQSQHGGNAA